MAGLNKVILIGNLGRDPEVRPIEGSNRIKTTFSLATSESYTDKEGQRITQTEWHNVVLWSPIAEIAEKYLRKGRQVYIEGKLTTRSYQDRDGNSRNITEVVGRNMVLLGGRNDMNTEGQEPAIPNASPQPQASSEEDELPF